MYFASTIPTFLENCRGHGADIAELIRAVGLHVKPDEQFEMPVDLLDSSLYEYTVDIIDSLLEKADIAFDRLEGKKRDNKVSENMQLSLAVDKERIIRNGTMDIEKPQNKFLSEIDNSRDKPFRPRIKTKLHAVAQLDLIEKPSLVDADIANEIVAPTTYFPHPYEAELRSLKYTPHQLTDMSSGAVE